MLSDSSLQTTVHYSLTFGWGVAVTIDVAGNTIEEVGEEGADDGGQDCQSDQQRDCGTDEECSHDVEDDGDGVGGDDVVVHKR